MPLRHAQNYKRNPAGADPGISNLQGRCPHFFQFFCAAALIFTKVQIHFAKDKYEKNVELGRMCGANMYVQKNGSVPFLTGKENFLFKQSGFHKHKHTSS